MTDTATDRKTYIVDVERSGDWWAIFARGIPNACVVSQARRLDQCEDMIRETIWLMLEVVTDSEVDKDSFDVELNIILDKATEYGIRRVQNSLEIAANATKGFARQMTDDGYTVRDVAELLGLSTRQVSKLLK